MERLTDKTWRNLDPWECCGQDNYCKRGCFDEGGCNNGCIVPKIYDKLAKYEDAEERGTLVKIPCKIGDTVYAIVNEKVLAVYVVSIVRHEWQPCWIVNLLFDRRKTNGVYAYSIDRFDRDVFLTREEAEAVLKGATS